MWLSNTTARWLRKLLLALGRRSDRAGMLRRSRVAAVRVAMRAARNSAAYRELLVEHGIDPSALRADFDPARLPVLTKAATFGRFPLTALMSPVRLSDIADVLTSSGHSGRNFAFRLTARKPYERSWFDIDLGLQQAFCVDDRPTLLVNCLPMGVVFRSRAVTVANVSVREDMACSIIRDVGSRFAQVIVCTDPMFVRRLLDEGDRVGVDWKALNVSLILGEEMLVEAQRDFLAMRLGMDIERDTHRLIGSSYGNGELGLNLLFETRETILMRRVLRRGAAAPGWAAKRPRDASVPALFAFNPMRTFIEVLDPDAQGFGELCITLLDASAVILLPRFATGDLGRLLSDAEAAELAREAGCEVPWLPMVAVSGRIADRHDRLPAVEQVKDVLYADPSVAARLSGAFRIGQDGDTAFLSLQTAEDADALDEGLRQALERRLAQEGMTVEVRLHGPLSFPWRPMLDFERKFAYLAPRVRPVEVFDRAGRSVIAGQKNPPENNDL